jgi:hypothetical protein
MGNKKNRKNKSNSSHRHVFLRRKMPWMIRKKADRGKKGTEQRESGDNPTTNQGEKDTTASSQHNNRLAGAECLKGSRIINIEQLLQYSSQLTAHASRCNGSIMLSGETRDGLASIFTGHCSTCDHTITFPTSQKVKGPRGYVRWECNLAAVWGQMAIGGGHSQLEEMMSVMGVPVMRRTTFINTERDIGEQWKQRLQESMLEAGKEEKRLAEERREFHDGVPAITVIVDGGWSKRSHKHSYNAKSGVAIIIGKATGKLLYLGVRNKYCSACEWNIRRDKHTCFKNWDASSSEMETDIILEGFKEAERVHGVRYIKFVGDGDSSVYPTLIQNVPGWGHAIQKLECANHMCKCYRGGLEKLVKENSSYKGKGGLTLLMRKKLVSAARCAIRMRSKETDVKKALASLKSDLNNGPRHCFGLHTLCSPDFCTTAKEQSQQVAPSSTFPILTSSSSSTVSSSPTSSAVRSSTPMPSGFMSSSTLVSSSASGVSTPMPSSAPVSSSTLVSPVLVLSSAQNALALVPSSAPAPSSTTVTSTPVTSSPGVSSTLHCSSHTHDEVSEDENEELNGRQYSWT